MRAAYKRNAAGVITGFAVATIICAGYVSDHVLGSSLERSLQDAKLLLKLIGNSYEVSSLERESVVYDSTKTYINLSFDSVEDFINSLQSLVNVSGADCLYKVSLGNPEYDKLLNVYSSVDGKVRVITDSSTGIIRNVNLLGLSELQELAIKDLMNSYTNTSGYRFGIISDGILLENVTLCRNSINKYSL